jgi:hypothetical protein
MSTVSKVRKEKEAVFVADCTVANQEADIHPAGTITQSESR